MEMNKIELIKEGEYWTLYVDGIHCGCGYFADMIEVIAEFKTTEDAEKYARQSILDRNRTIIGGINE